MAAVALRREIDAYGDIIDQYNREGKKYTKQGEAHNASVDAYNASLVKGSSGEILGLRAGGRSGTGYHSASGGHNVDFFNQWRADRSSVNLIDAGDGWFVAQTKDASGKFPSNPGQFTAVAPTKPGEGPSPTIGQIKRMDGLGLADYERGNVGLLAAARNG
jgi:hypothetical protein